MRSDLRCPRARARGPAGAGARHDRVQRRRPEPGEAVLEFSARLVEDHLPGPDQRPVGDGEGGTKRLRGLDQPQYRLRVDEMRVFYDVTQTTVQVLAIVTKAEAQAWLDDEGTPSASGGSGGSEG